MILINRRETFKRFRKSLFEWFNRNGGIKPIFYGDHVLRDSSILILPRIISSNNSEFLLSFLLFFINICTFE